MNLDKIIHILEEETGKSNEAFNIAQKFRVFQEKPYQFIFIYITEEGQNKYNFSWYHTLRPLCPSEKVWGIYPLGEYAFQSWLIKTGYEGELTNEMYLKAMESFFTALIKYINSDSETREQIVTTFQLIETQKNAFTHEMVWVAFNFLQIYKDCH